MFKPLALTMAATVAFACSVDYAIWIPRTKEADPLYRFVKNGKAGYIDQAGHVVIPPTFEVTGNSGGEFHDGLLEINANDGRYIDRSGKAILYKGLDGGWGFSEGLAVAKRKGENLWGYVNTRGGFAITPRFQSGFDSYVLPFSDGLAMIEVKGKYGYIDHSGAFVIKPQFLIASGFSDGMARVVTDGPCIYLPEGPCPSFRMVGGANPSTQTLCKSTFIDKTGHRITTEGFDNARDFSEGLAPIQIGKLWAFIDKTGRLDIPPRFEDAQPFHSGLARIRDHDRYGYADKSGQIAILLQWTYASDFSEGFAVVGNSPGPGFYIGRDGRRAFPGDFQRASPFFKGLAHVCLQGCDDPDNTRAHYAYIDTTGRRVFTYDAPSLF
jgi:WG containing repeat